MAKNNKKDAIDEFYTWLKNASNEELYSLAEELVEEALMLEQDDWFGTEGINKRFA